MAGRRQCLRLKPARDQVFEHFYFAIQAAIGGLGVVMGPLALVGDDLRERRLLAPLKEPALRTRGYFVYAPTTNSEVSAIAAFRKWLLGAGSLADLVGRDYTTVSRQVAKLESLGLITRQSGKTDRRVTEAVVTEKGQAVSELFDAARERLAQRALADWSEQDLKELARLLRRFTDNLMQNGPS